MTKCTHDWRTVNTTVNQMHGVERNPVFFLVCRHCGATTIAEGQAALKALSDRKPIATGPG